MSDKIKPETGAEEGLEASNVISLAEWRRRLRASRTVPSGMGKAETEELSSARESFAEFNKRLGKMTKEEIAAYAFNVLM